MIQVSSATKMNRYPELFEIASKELKHIQSPKILSFGCSTGEEPLSIRGYIPGSQIVGVDINHRALSIAKRRAREDGLLFFHYSDEKWISEAPYDCVFAMAVFQKSINRDEKSVSASESFTFSKFSNMIGQLDSVLKPGGLLVIDHSDFSFLDLTIASHYSASKNDKTKRRKRPVYSMQNTREDSSHESNRIFVKNPE